MNAIPRYASHYITSTASSNATFAQINASAVSAAQSRKACPNCARSIPKAATKCPVCGQSQS